jgi:flagellar protein FlbD
VFRPLTPSLHRFAPTADEDSGSIPSAMIQLTRLNGNPFYVNIDLIKWAEAAPDTMLSLTNGEKVVVREPCDEVVERLQNYRVHLLVLAARFATETAMTLVEDRKISPTPPLRPPETAIVLGPDSA